MRDTAVNHIRRLARSAEADALLAKLEQLSAKDWRTVYERFSRMRMAEWGKIHEALLDAADGWDPFKGLPKPAHERMSEELRRQVNRTTQIAERLPEASAGEPQYRAKLHFAMGRLLWLLKTRESIHSEKGRRAAAIVDSLFEGVLPDASEGGHRTNPERRPDASAPTGGARSRRRPHEHSVPPFYRELVAVWDGIEPLMQTRAGEQRLSHGQRLVHELFFRLDSEVRNGGVEQYLYNSAGDRAESAKAYLAEIEAWPTLTVLDEVSALFPGGAIPTNRRRRVALLEQAERLRNDFSNPLGEATERYAQAQRELYGRIMAYVRHHPADFDRPS
jgi:hypothetical protein